MENGSLGNEPPADEGASSDGSDPPRADRLPVSCTTADVTIEDVRGAMGKVNASETQEVEAREEPEQPEEPEMREGSEGAVEDHTGLDAAVAAALLTSEESGGGTSPCDVSAPQSEIVADGFALGSSPRSVNGDEMAVVEDKDFGKAVDSRGGTETFSSSLSTSSSAENLGSEGTASFREAPGPASEVSDEASASGVAGPAEAGFGGRKSDVAVVKETQTGSHLAETSADHSGKGQEESFQSKAQRLMEDNRRYQAEFEALLGKSPRDEGALDRVWRNVMATQEDYERLTESFVVEPVQASFGPGDEVAGSGPSAPTAADAAIEIDELQHRRRMLQQQVDAVSQEIAFLQKERPPDVVKIHELRMTVQKLEEDLVHSRKRLEELNPGESEDPVTSQVHDVEPSVAHGSSPLMCGNLVKEGHVIKNWKTRWFELVDDRLNYYVSEQNRILKGQIRLTAAVKVEELDKFPHGLTVYGGPNKPYKMTAESDELRSKWVGAISRKIAELPK